MIIKLSTLAVLASAAAMSTPLFYEDFSNVSALSGWAIINNSTPGGQTPEGWFQGSGVFLTPSGSPTSYIQANFENAGSPGDISTWLLTLPPVAITAGAHMIFSTIAEDVPGFPDRLEVRWSPGIGADVGSTPFSVGQFTETLLTINPQLQDDGYPTSWTTYGYTFNAAQAGVGRIGFRYSVTDRMTNGSTVALDFVAFVPEPGTVSLMLLGAAAMALAALRRRSLRKGVVSAAAVVLSVSTPAWSTEKNAVREPTSAAAGTQAGTAAQKIAIDPDTGLPTRPSSEQAPAARTAVISATETYVNLPNGGVGRVVSISELNFLVVETKPDGSLKMSHKPQSAMKATPLKGAEK